MRLTINVKGPVGICPFDDAFDTFEVVGTQLKPGRAETAIANLISQMLENFGKTKMSGQEEVEMV